MPRFAANLSMLWPDLEPFQRFDAAAGVGFAQVELLFPHELDADRLAITLENLDLEMVDFDPYPGDWAGGERGLLALPGREQEFFESVRDAIALATRIGTTRLNTLVGIPPAGLASEQVRETVIANLNRVAPLAQDAGVTLLVEAINNVDIPGYWAGTVAVAAGLVTAVDHPNVRLQLDQYHAAMAGEDAIDCLRTYFSIVSHVQIADAPGRHEPGTGVQPIASFLRELDRLGYEGFVGLEYRPLVDTASSLAWIRTMDLRRQ